MQAAPETHATTPGDEPARGRDVLRAVRDDGDVDGAFRSALDVGLALYRHMLTLRLVSVRMVSLQRAEKIGFHSACIGDEAVVAGATLAARENDWVFPGRREWGAAIVRGLPIAAYVHHAFGSSVDAAKGHSAPDHPPAKKVRVGPASGIVGAHISQAVGAAWAAKISKRDEATIALFGDDATRTGDFHSALNFAGVFKPSCVLVCREECRDDRARHDPPTSKAVAYGLASARVDGGDALAVFAVVREAIARASRGLGSTLVDAPTPRMTPGPSLFSVEAWQRPADLLAMSESDPLVVLRRVLERENLLDAAAHDAIAAEVRAAIDLAVAEAELASAPAPSTLFEDVYAEVPAHLRAQKESSPWRR